MARWRMTFVAVMVVTLVLAAVAGDRAISTPQTVKRATGVAPDHNQGNSLDEIIYLEDWETGDLNGWTPIDLTATPSPWHRDDNTAFGGAGMSWWCGDSTINGYLDDWYMVLDSPPIQLGATPSLLFWHRRSVEDPAGAESVPGYPPNTFDGWDGVNIRISTNNGQTWTVIPGNVITPTYNCTSLFSFGDQHGEGRSCCDMDSGNRQSCAVGQPICQDSLGIRF